MLLINYEKEFNTQELYQIFYSNNTNLDVKNIEDLVNFQTKITNFLNDNEHYFLIARDGKIAVGYMIFKLDNETLIIEDMQIAENYQGKRMLFRDFLFFAKTKTSTKIKFISAVIPNRYSKAQKIAKHLKMQIDTIFTDGIKFVGKIKKI